FGLGRNLAKEVVPDQLWNHPDLKGKFADFPLVCDDSCNDGRIHAEMKLAAFYKHQNIENHFTKGGDRVTAEPLFQFIGTSEPSCFGCHSVLKGMGYSSEGCSGVVDHRWTVPVLDISNDPQECVEKMWLNELTGLKDEIMKEIQKRLEEYSKSLTPLNA